MTVPNPPLAHERLIAELAVQRAALVTKHVQRTRLNFVSPSPITSPISQVLNHDPFDTHIPNNSSTGQGQGQASTAKDDRTPVTIADYAAQALLTSAVHAAFPEDRIIGEEEVGQLRGNMDMARQVWELVDQTRLEDEEMEGLLGRPRSFEEMMACLELGDGNRNGNGAGTGDSEGKKGGRFWVMDPVDGTSSFMKGGQYAISLALLEEGTGRELIGVLGCPNMKLLDGWRVKEGVVDEEGMGLMLAAVRGQGATMRAIGRGRLREAIEVKRGKGKPVDSKDLHFIHSTKSPATLRLDEAAVLVNIRSAPSPGTELYSSHMRYAAMVLGGRECVQVRVPKVPEATWSIWDHAGSQLIYTESGAGKVTDMSGNPIDFTTGKKLSNSWGLITADESIHGELLTRWSPKMQGSKTGDASGALELGTVEWEKTPRTPQVIML